MAHDNRNQGERADRFTGGAEGLRFFHDFDQLDPRVKARLRVAMIDYNDHHFLNYQRFKGVEATLRYIEVVDQKIIENDSPYQDGYPVDLGILRERKRSPK